MTTYTKQEFRKAIQMLATTTNTQDIRWLMGGHTALLYHYTNQYGSIPHLLNAAYPIDIIIQIWHLAALKLSEPELKALTTSTAEKNQSIFSKNFVNCWIRNGIKSSSYHSRQTRRAAKDFLILIRLKYPYLISNGFDYPYFDHERWYKMTGALLEELVKSEKASETLEEYLLQRDLGL